MKLSEFDTKMPLDLIAEHPAKNRDESRLLVLHRHDGEIEHREFKDILDYFGPHDLFVFNDTQVFPAKLMGNKEKTGARIEVFLLRELNQEHRLWDVLVEPARKIRIGNKLYFGLDDSMVAEVIDNTTSRGRTLRFLYDGPHDEFKAALFALGSTPLPYYIKRESEEDDVERYQTIFARKEGAVVAPAAGLHFSRELMRRMEIRDIESDFLTLHIGLGCFREIDVEDLTKHRMDSEQMEITPELVQHVNSTRDAGGKICAIGTSTLRALETCVGMNGHIKSYSGWTNKFIFPPYECTTAHALVSNLHLPYSVMLMLTASFGGYEKVMKAYQVAIEEKYRFGVYGDAMLIVD
jgi:S-adenosylmethionine:tRNA ribosyltransferase-isomerase